MKAMGYVDGFDFGIERAESLQEKNGKPSLEFDVDDRMFAVPLLGVTP